MKRRLVDLLPFVLGGTALILTFVGWKTAEPPIPVSFLEYVVRQKTDFALALATLFCQYFVTLLLLRELNAELSGKWDIIVSPTNWKGATNQQLLAAIAGTGTLFLSKPQKSADSYRGILLVTFTEGSAQGMKTEIHRGAYEITLTRETVFDFQLSVPNFVLAFTSQKVTGWSLAVVESGSPANIGPPDFPSQNKCLYDLKYSSSTRRMSGTAKMKDSETISEFDAIKIE